MTPSDALETMSNAALVALFNAATGETIARFSDRRTGIDRIKSAVEARAEVELEVQDGQAVVKRIETREERRGSPEKTDRMILEILAEIGPAKIGAIRAVFRQRDAHFAALRDKQAKGRMRASVQRLEASGRIVKDRTIFKLPSPPATRPGDAAAIYAEEAGVSFERALVACNMD